MLIGRPYDYQKADYQKCYCHNYLIKTLKIFKSTCLGLSIKKHEDIKHYDNQAQDYFYLYPISTLKSIIQVGCKWIKIAYTNFIKKCFAINHLL